MYYTIYKFLLPGLTYLESRLLKIAGQLSLALLILAYVLLFVLILPYAISFFLSFQSNYPDTSYLTYTGRILPFLTFILKFNFSLALLFQLPLVLLIVYIQMNHSASYFLSWFDKSLFKTSLDKLSSRKKNVNKTTSKLKPGKFNKLFIRKLLFFSLVLLTAILSPPDVYSQVVLFVPLWMLLESFLFLSLVFKEWQSLSSKQPVQQSSQQSFQKSVKKSQISRISKIKRP